MSIENEQKNTFDDDELEDLVLRLNAYWKGEMGKKEGEELIDQILDDPKKLKLIEDLKIPNEMIHEIRKKYKNKW